MNYNDYKASRDLAWRVLINENIPGTACYGRETLQADGDTGAVLYAGR